MDAQAKKAAFRAKLKENALKQKKRIESPLVQYNEFDQPVCRVCDVVLKSESLWPAHQVSRKHHEAVQNFKANAAERTREKNVKPEVTSTDSLKPSSKRPTQLHIAKPPEQTRELHKHGSFNLPEGFFDDPDTKKQKSGLDGVELPDLDPREKTVISAQINLSNTDAIDGLSGVETTETVTSDHLDKDTKDNTSRKISGTEAKQVKGTLPEGFFDNKDADLRARGIEPVKLDVKDEYKEFEKLIQEDLQEVDDRLEEEEFDAAETIEGTEYLEQKACVEKVEMLKKKKMELKAARLAKRSKSSEVTDSKYSHEESSSDGDSEGDFAVDWRAKHL